MPACPTHGIVRTVCTGIGPQTWQRGKSDVRFAVPLSRGPRRSGSNPILLSSAFALAACRLRLSSSPSRRPVAESEIRVYRRGWTEQEEKKVAMMACRLRFHQRKSTPFHRFSSPPFSFCKTKALQSLSPSSNSSPITFLHSGNLSVSMKFLETFVCFRSLINY